MKQLYGQGPPITSDKPLMLGGKRKVLKTLVEYREFDGQDVIYAPLMIHYLPSAKTFLAVHTPLVFSDEAFLGDVRLIGKYQFYRKDTTGSTIRMALKLQSTLPTGKAIEIPDFSYGKLQTYLGFIAGKESLKHGLLAEVGYNFVPGVDIDELRARLGFGLPILKPVYPVKQVNLYFEYASNWLIEQDKYELLYAQGIQYARNSWTLEMSVQFPLIQAGGESKRGKSLFIGSRYVF